MRRVHPYSIAAWRKPGHTESMTNFFAPADRADDWQKLLAKPELHWKTGYSAKSLAYCWTEAKGFPAEVALALNTSTSLELHNLEFLLGFPEYDVDLPGGKRPSQNDVFVLARNQNGTASIAVEGKVSESFDLPIGQRFANPTSGQTERLNYLCELLQLQRDSIEHIGYQLLHRSASALIEAERFGANRAIMLIHSFSRSLEHFDDYANFCSLYSMATSPNQVSHAARIKDIDFYLGWIVGEPEYLQR